MKKGAEITTINNKKAPFHCGKEKRHSHKKEKMPLKLLSFLTATN